MNKDERYTNFIDIAVKNKLVWLLEADEGMFAMFEDNNGQEYVPVWPDEKETGIHIKDDWCNYIPVSLKLYEFNSWLKELANDKIMIAVWPDDTMQTIPMQPLDLKKHIEEELKTGN